MHYRFGEEVEVVEVKGELVVEVLMVMEGKLIKVKVMEMKVMVVEVVREVELEMEEAVEGRQWWT